MNFIDLYSFLFDNKKPLGGSIFMGRSGNSILIGPLVKKSFCVGCFRKRLLSSDFLKEIEYRKTRTSDIKRAYWMISQHRVKMSPLKMYEYNQSSSKFHVHYILNVPGCRHQYVK